MKEFIVLNDNVEKYKEQLSDFLNKLNSEKKYFEPTLERFIKSEIVIALMNDEIYGIAGLEKKYSIYRNYLMLNKSCHGKGYGKSLLLRLLSESKKKSNILMALINNKNVISLKLHQSLNYKAIGNRGSLIYLLKPLNRKGWFLFYIIKMFFLFFRLGDVIRR